MLWSQLQLGVKKGAFSHVWGWFLADCSPECQDKQLGMCSFVFSPFALRMDSPHCTVRHEVAMTRLWSCSWSEVPHCWHGPRCVCALVEYGTPLEPSTELSVSLRRQGGRQECNCCPKGDVIMGRMIQNKVFLHNPSQIYEKCTLVCLFL